MLGAPARLPSVRTAPILHYTALQLASVWLGDTAGRLPTPGLLEQLRLRTQVPAYLEQQLLWPLDSS